MAGGGGSGGGGGRGGGGEGGEDSGKGKQAAEQAATDAICAAIADQAVEECLIFLQIAPANRGQEVLCESMMRDVLKSWTEVYEGKPPVIIPTMHPEAVGIIAEEVSDVLTEAAIEVKEIRQIAEALQQL